MGRCCNWLPEAVAIAGSAIGTAIALRGWPSINVPDGMGGNLAEWAQVLGTIGAILGAFSLGARQHKNERERDRLAKIETESALKAVVDLVTTVGCEVVNASQLTREEFFHKWRRALRSDCEVAIAAFDQLPLHQLGSPERIAHAFRIRNCVSHLMRLSMEMAAQKLGDNTFKLMVSNEVIPQANALKFSMDGFANEFKSADQTACKKVT